MIKKVPTIPKKKKKLEVEKQPQNLLKLFGWPKWLLGLCLCVPTGPGWFDLRWVLMLLRRYLLAGIKDFISGRWVKQIALHNVGGPPPISWRSYEERELRSLHEEEILPPDRPQTWDETWSLPWVSSLLVCPADFGCASPHNYLRQFLNINLSRQTQRQIHRWWVGGW